MTKQRSLLVTYFKSVLEVLDAKEKLILAVWITMHLTLLLLDFAALALIGLVASTFIPIIQSKPRDFPRVISNLYERYGYDFSLLEFIFLLAVLAGTMLLVRSFCSIVIDRFFYKELCKISDRLLRDSLNQHFKRSIDQRLDLDDFRFLRGIHDSLNSFTIYSLGNLIVVSAEILIFLLLFTALVFWQPKIAVILLFYTLTLIFVFFLVHIKKTRKLADKFFQQNTRVMGHFLQINRQSQELLLRGKLQDEIDQYLEFRKSLSLLLANRQIQFGIPRFIIEALILVGGVSSALFVWYFYSASEGLVVLSTLLVVGLRTQPAIIKIQNGMQILLQHCDASKDFYDITMHYRRTDTAGLEACEPISREKTPVLRIEDLGYGFDDDMFLFAKLNFEFSGFGIYRIEGNNGSGKTTLLEVILGLRKKYSGIVRLNGVDLESHSPSCIGAHIAYMPQESSFFEQSLNDYLAMSEDLQGSDYDKKPKIFYVLKELGFPLDKFSLEDVANLETMLSEGEKAKVALARTLALDCPIVLLDEPSASLDTESKRRLFNLLESESKSRLIIVIVHEDTTQFISQGVLSI